eukprot:COSAG05_NODE_53_length_23772_cov_13.856630_17_plen_88_part_00
MSSFATSIIPPEADWWWCCRWCFGSGICSSQRVSKSCSELLLHWFLGKGTQRSVAVEIVGTSNAIVLQGAGYTYAVGLDWNTRIFQK